MMLNCYNIVMKNSKGVMFLKKNRLLIVGVVCIMGFVMLTGCNSKELIPNNESISTPSTFENELDNLLVKEEKLTKEDKQFIDAYIEYTETKNEENIADMMMKNYFDFVKTEIIEKTESTMKLKITTPNMVKLTNMVIEELKETENLEKTMVEEVINNYLLNQEFENLVFEVEVNYTEKDGEIVIEENIEYLNAIYGGMLVESQNRYKEYKESITTEVTVND